MYKLNSASSEPATGADSTSDYVATVHANGSLRLFDLSMAAWKKRVDVIPSASAFGHGGRVVDCSFSNDALMVSTVGEDNVRTLVPWVVPHEIDKCHCHMNRLFSL